MYGGGSEGGPSLSPSPPPPRRPAPPPPLPMRFEPPPPMPCQRCRLQRHNSCASAYSAATTFHSFALSSSLRLKGEGGRLLSGAMPTLPGGGGGGVGLGGDAFDGDEDSCPVICDREMHSLHRNVPALRRRDVDTAAIRQHFYPDGGWGWIVAGAAFIAHLLTSGLQLSFGLLAVFVAQHLRAPLMDAVWVGVVCLATSLLVAPLVVALCRRKSTRLSAIFGGLVMALGCLFASFALQLHQVLLSYGLVMGVGCCLVRETASLMLGQYFKRRREFVESVAACGGGVGVALFSVLYKEAVGALGWRLGMQAVTGVLTSGFFVGVLYRSASLYHPQRRAIVHLKNQRKKIKEKKHVRVRNPKPPFLDLSPLRLRPVRWLMAAAGAASAGVYTPLFYLAGAAHSEGQDDGSLVLLQTFLGLALAVGSAGFGAMAARPSHHCLVSRQALAQSALAGIALSLVALTAVRGHHGYSLVACLYGVCLAGFTVSLKLLTLQRVRSRYFARAWALVQCCQAAPLLVGAPLSGYVSAAHAQAGYFVSLVATASAATLLCFGGGPVGSMGGGGGGLGARGTSEDGRCLCSSPPPPRLPKSLSLGATLDAAPWPPWPAPVPWAPGMRASRSEPDRLGEPPRRPAPRRQLTVVEQMTTSV